MVYHDFVNQALKHTSGALMSGRFGERAVGSIMTIGVTIILNYRKPKIHSGMKFFRKTYLILKDGEVLHAGYPEVSDG